MAKELPYFQFEPSEWQNGNIQMASNEAKIAFIEILCSYWQRLGSLPYAFALQRHCGDNENALLELLNCNAIKKVEGEIVISFLDSQLKGLESKSQKARESANKRWNKGENANAMRTHTKRNANRIDKNRIDKSKEVTTKKSEKYFSEEVSNCFENCIKFFPEDLRPEGKSIEKWKNCIKLLNEKDQINFPDIELLVKVAREDNFWNKNFLSLLRLRQKNKEGVVYWKVFKARFSQEKKPNKGESDMDWTERMLKKMETEG